MGKARAELLAPAANRLVADRHAALEEQLLDVTQTPVEPIVPPHRMADDRRREPVAVIKRFRFRHPIMLREHLANVTAPSGMMQPESTVIEDFADHQVFHEDETIEASNSGFIAVNRFEQRQRGSRLSVHHAGCSKRPEFPSIFVLTLNRDRRHGRDEIPRMSERHLVMR